MENSTELRTVVYNVLLTQIQFGVYHFREKLPTIEETSGRLCVSVDTARSAYLKLKEKGYITLSKNVGATVKVDYNAQETEEYIQTFFSTRKHAIIDLGRSIQPLFCNAQYLGLKNASPEMLTAMEGIFGGINQMAPYAILKHLNQKYDALGNNLLMRLVWQSFMFLHNPFFSIAENRQYFDHSLDYLPNILRICQNRDWKALRAAVEQPVENLSTAISRFYRDRITMPAPKEEMAFAWSSYKKSQQMCYSFAMELLISISRGIYPAGSILPSQKELANQKGISLSTVRRALELLASVGAIKASRYVGTQVLPFENATENSDFTKPVLQRRLLDTADSLQMLALSCKDVSTLTLSSLSPDSIERMCQELKAQKKAGHGETLSYFILNLIAQHAPYQTIRTVYSELLRQFFWAYALRGMMEKNQESINAIYAPYQEALTASLEKRDFVRFSALLEEFIIDEFHRTMESMSQLHIPGTRNILLPDCP